jgi:hypothetical protein
MIRQLLRDMGPAALVMVPVNVAAAALLVAGSVIADSAQSGTLALILLVVASLLAGVLTLGLAKAAAAFVEQGWINAQSPMRALVSFAFIARGMSLGLLVFALPIVVVGQLHVALTSGQAPMIAASFLTLGLLIVLSPLIIVMTVAVAHYPDRSVGSLLQDALASISASPRQFVGLGVAAFALGIASVATIAPMFTCYSMMLCLLGARLVVAPLESGWRSNTEANLQTLALQASAVGGGSRH